MLTYLKNLIAELSFFRHRRETMRDISQNPLLDWWREHDFDPRFADLFFKMPPSLVYPVTDEEVFIAIDLAENIRFKNYDREALKAGQFKPSKITRLKNAAPPVFAILVVFALDLLSSISAGFDPGFLFNLYVYMLLLLFSPLIWFYRNIWHVKCGIRDAWPGNFTLLTITYILLLSQYLPVMDLHGKTADKTLALQFVVLLMILSVFVYFLICYSIRLVKQKIHQRRMET